MPLVLAVDDFTDCGLCGRLGGTAVLRYVHSGISSATTCSGPMSTGAGRGIGAATAVALAEAGADVLISARTEDQLVSPAGGYVTGKILEVDGGIERPNLDLGLPDL